MRAPLENIDRLDIGYRFGEKTWYSDHHLGIDYICATGTPVFAPEMGIATQKYGAQGGNTVELVGTLTHRFMHLSRYGKSGQVNAGDVIGYVGNTGNTSTGPHLHWDTRRNRTSWEFFKNYVNPAELIDKVQEPEQEESMEIQPGVTLEVTSGGCELRTVPTDIQGQYEVNASLGRGDWCEVIEQTPGFEWCHVNAAGVKQGWTRTSNFKVIYRKDLIEKPPVADQGTKAKAVAMAQALVESISKL